MKAFKFLPLMAMLRWTVGETDPSAPGCAIHCWQNTQYVSKRKCAGDAACLCSEPGYQNVVFQCLYSQCDTAHFGSALHHIIAQCFGTGTEIPVFAAPPIPNRQELRRREAEFVAGAKIYGSGSAVGYPTESVSFLTQSAGYPTQSVGGPYSPSPTSIPTFFYSLNTSTSPAISSVTPTEPMHNAVAVSTTTPLPQMFTGLASATGPAMTFAVLVLIGTFYLSL